MKNILIALFVLILFASSVSAYKNACLTYGQSVPNSQTPRFTCDKQLCQLCVDDKNYPTHPGYCNKMKPCTPESPLCDKDHPLILTVNNPKDNSVFNYRKINFNLSTNKLSDFYYIDNIDGRGRWSKLTTNAVKYQKGISFKEGLNDITIKAVDKCDTEVTIVRKFFVDTKKPKFGKITSDGIGTFNVDFSEENPVKLSLKYGNSIKGMKEILFDLSKCENNNGKYKCSLKLTYEQYIASISIYSNQNIKYYYELYDVVNNSARSKETEIYVDITAPVIKNPGTMVSVKDKFAIFNISIDETNFKEVSYTDITENNLRSIKICSSLKNGICYKKVNFKSGVHILDVNVLDKSNNPTIKRIQFSIA